MLKRLCALLILLLVCSCASAEQTVTLSPYQSSDAEIAYAALLGLDEPHLVYAFAADTPGTIRLNVYTWQENTWQMSNSQCIPYTGDSGRFALACEALEKQLRIALQCDRQSTELICHPLFSQAASGLTDTQVSLSETAEIPFGQEIPLVLQSSGGAELTLDDYNRPSAIPGPAYAITIVFEKGDVP